MFTPINKAIKIIGGEVTNVSNLAYNFAQRFTTPKKVCEDIRLATRQLKGKKLNVEINVVANKQCEVSVIDPTANKQVMQQRYELMDGQNQKIKENVEGMDLEIDMNQEPLAIEKQGNNKKKFIDVDISVRNNVCEVRMFDQDGEELLHQTQEVVRNGKPIDIDIEIPREMVAEPVEIEEEEVEEDAKLAEAEEVEAEEEVSQNPGKQAAVTPAPITVKAETKTDTTSGWTTMPIMPSMKPTVQESPVNVGNSMADEQPQNQQMNASLVSKRTIKEFELNSDKNSSFTIVLHPNQIGAKKTDRIIDYSYQEIRRTENGAMLRVQPKVVDSRGRPVEIDPIDLPIDFDN